MARSEGPIQVMIYDQEYQMRGQLDPDYMRKLGEYVDAKMRAIAAGRQTVDSLRVAVLAALNIADAYHQLKAQHEQIGQKVDECSAILDQLFEQGV